MPIHVFGCWKSGATTRVKLPALEVVGAFGSFGSGGEDCRYEDPVLQIKSDLLDEVDGPMLQYGLKERHNQKLMVLPKARIERPGPEFLEFRYQLFQGA